MVTFEDVRDWALALPGVEEGTSYGTAAFRVRGKLIARLRDEDGALVVKVDPGYREALIGAAPEIYFMTPHYARYPAVLVRLTAANGDELRDLLTDAWRDQVPKRLLADFDAQRRAD